jgi:iron(III) transport system substrate-binding protein
MGLINHYYFFRIRSEASAGSFHARLAFFAPRDPGFVEDISAAGILKSAPHPAAAQKFLAFLVSKAGQSVIAHSASYEYPLVSGVAPNPALSPVGTLKPNPITPAAIGTGTDARDLLRQAGLI